MQLTSATRRALGLLAVSTVGMSTAVLGVTGIAQAAVPSWTATADGQQDPIPAGICAVEWTLTGGGAGLDSDGQAGDDAGVLYAVTPVAENDVFTLVPGGSGTDAADASTPGTGGTRDDGDASLEGDDGTVDAGVAGGGGGAASTVTSDGDIVLQAYGADAYGDAGGLGGGDSNLDTGAAYSEEDTDSSGDPGSITGEGVPCAPATPELTWAEGLDGKVRLHFSEGYDGSDVATVSYEYTKNGGTTWTALPTPSDDEGRLLADVTGLTNATEYTFQIRAVGGADTAPSDPSEEAKATPYKKATAPGNVKVVTGDGKVTVSWTASTAGTYPIAGYGVGWYISGENYGNGGLLCQTKATVFTCTAPVQPGVKHNLTVQAVDTGGNSGEVVKTTTDVVPASSTVPKSDGTMTVPAGSSTAVPAGKTITFTGSGYAPNSTVTVTIYSTPQILTTVVTDGTGSFTVTVTVPAGLAAGKHTLVASGFDGAGKLRTLTLPVTVVDGLAYTGADIGLPVMGGLAALTVGGALIFASRRRKVS